MTRLTAAPVLALILLASPFAAIGVPSGEADAAPAGSFVVIAIVDTGINPYHLAFRGATYPRNVDADPANDVDFTAHPSTFISGYPTDAPALHVTLDAASYSLAVAADEDAYAAVENNKLYWIPGTKIIGAYDGNSNFGNAGADNHHILDDDSHGTGAAGLAAGHDPRFRFSFCPECLIVVVEGTGGLNWALNQPWIDIVSNSWGTTGNVGTPTTFLIRTGLAGRLAAERGQLSLFASGNGAEGAFTVPVSTYTSNYAGPPWFMRIAAYSACFSAAQDPCNQDTEAPIIASGRPADMAGPGNGYIPTAHYTSFEAIYEFSGTSAATPIAAGYAGRALLTLREALGDTAEGQRPGQVVAQGAPLTGTPFFTPADDGVVTRAEWWDLVLHNSAHPVNGTYLGTVPPDAPGNFAYYGWGLVNGAATHQVRAAAVGEAPWPDKEEERRFAVFDKFAQELLWGAWDRDGDGASDSYRAEVVAETNALLQLP